MNGKQITEQLLNDLSTIIASTKIGLYVQSIATDTTQSYSWVSLFLAYDGRMSTDISESWFQLTFNDYNEKHQLFKWVWLIFQPLSKVFSIQYLASRLLFNFLLSFFFFALVLNESFTTRSKPSPEKPPAIPFLPFVFRHYYAQVGSPIK